MQVKDLKPGMDKVEIELTVDFVGQIRKGEYGESPNVRTYLRDETGEIAMTFWGDLCRKVKKGMKVKVKNGYVTEYKGDLQLNYKEGEDPELTK
ncbi:hypothetical protein DRJ17_06215 [Candidatus Woesearchaeota archaeon]|nr:MAG: hypothetical protein DRJ17_06215 [Candidatus Woesearchaeota archaeon]